MEEISDAEANREKLIKISESPDNEFVSCVKKAELEKDMTQVSSLISKANTLNWQSEELKQDAKQVSYSKPKEKTWIILPNVLIFVDYLLVLVLIYVLLYVFLS